ncbi:hypothetical protein LA20531_07260 [Lactobacillus amylovorus DSM 20531]|uniref:hypothetical protein n=1 Tax=Lactobacillus amylovorus TaxID=1604 RepID=UPI0006F17192|nr:hypothetical protein [Lactobacillus amylovorus]ATO53430.1 hypothetical protein LA20531_07260 [Lactobacillus amylovorus DSM 20531]KRK42557.1 hypothetical protein FC63_GL000725 [Lactobacillus amylovorus DSM 20531]MCT3593187.1 hypothetical protein [Lactobacillus amylovorus]
MEAKPDFRVLKIPDTTNYWFVRANSRGEYYQDYYLNDFIATDSNGISIENIVDILVTNNNITDPLSIKNRLKQYFNDHDLKLLNNKLNERKDLTKDEKEELKTKELRKSTTRSTRVNKFVNEIKLGDFVFVPADSSTKFLVGIIISDCLDNNIEHKTKANKNYHKCNFSLIRKVKWIKELTFEEMPDALSWIRSAHQSIFDISSYADLINSCISSLYEYKGQIFYRLNVHTNKQIPMTDWLDYQLLINDIVGDGLDDIYQKIKVQSPGNINLSTLKAHWRCLALIPLILFGSTKIQIGDITTQIQNPLDYFTPEGKRSKKLDNDLKQANIDAKIAEAKKTEAEADKIKAETKAIEQSNKAKERSREIEDKKKEAARLKAKSDYYKNKGQENSKLIEKQFGSKTERTKINSLPHIDEKKKKSVISKFDMDDKNIGIEVK